MKDLGLVKFTSKAGIRGGYVLLTGRMGVNNAVGWKKLIDLKIDRDYFDSIVAIAEILP